MEAPPKSVLQDRSDTIPRHRQTRPAEDQRTSVAVGGRTARSLIVGWSGMCRALAPLTSLQSLCTPYTILNCHPERIVSGAKDLAPSTHTHSEQEPRTHLRLFFVNLCALRVFVVRYCSLLLTLAAPIRSPRNAHA